MQCLFIYYLASFLHGQLWQVIHWVGDIHGIGCGWLTISWSGFDTDWEVSKKNKTDGKPTTSTPHKHHDVVAKQYGTSRKKSQFYGLANVLPSSDLNTCETTQNRQKINSNRLIKYFLNIRLSWKCFQAKATIYLLNLHVLYHDFAIESLF